MEVFDKLVPDLMKKWEIPGGAIAIARDGRLVLAKGYGLADIDREELVRPDSLFRVASVSKPVTATAILKLVEDGRLDLDAHVFQILDKFQAPDGTTLDPKISDVTVRQLLQHSGGWDSNKSYDPMFVPGRIEREIGVLKPVSCPDVISFMLGQPLDFDPGTQYAYSNFGYCLLGRVIEEITGQTYEEYVRSRILQPAGITRMRIGGTLPQDRAEGEVRYYGYPGQPLGDSVLADTADRVPWHYGGFHLQTLDAHGGWIASPIDLARFVTALDGSRPALVFEEETVTLMVSPPDPRLEPDPQTHYGMGWSVRPVGDNANWWHNGSLPGTHALLIRTHHGMIWAALFNSRPEEWQQFLAEVDWLMWDGVGKVTDWPAHDLFPHFGYQ